jgi:hypothetical protein
MTTLIYILFVLQALGAFVGAVTTILAEIEYIRAMRDGKIDDAETVHLHMNAWGLRVGMTVLAASSVALALVAYLRNGLPQSVLSASYWILIMLAFLVISVTWALSQRHISFALGSAAVFTGWWFLAYLLLGAFPPLSFTTAVAFFVVATVIFYVILRYGRILSLRKK